MSLSTFLNGRPPTRLRGLLFLTLSESGAVLRFSSTSDVGGGASQAWINVGTTECRIDPLGGSNERITGGRIDERSTHVVTVPPDIEVSAGDRFAISGRGTFEITQVRARTSPAANAFEVVER